MRRLRHLLRAARHVATNREIPRPVRWLAVAGALPIPGPVDEALLLLAAAVLAVFYRPQLRAAWLETA